MKKVLSAGLAVVLVVIIILIVVADFIMPKDDTEVVTPGAPVITIENKETASSTATSTEKKVVTPKVTYTTSITRNHNSKVVYVKRGGQFTLALGDLDWTVTIGDTSVIGQVQNFQVVRGVQGTYTGIRPGTTTIRAEGRPHCDSGKSCINTVTSFKVTVVVK